MPQMYQVIFLIVWPPWKPFSEQLDLTIIQGRSTLTFKWHGTKGIARVVEDPIYCARHLFRQNIYKVRLLQICKDFNTITTCHLYAVIFLNHSYLTIVRTMRWSNLFFDLRLDQTCYLRHVFLAFAFQPHFQAFSQNFAHLENMKKCNKSKLASRMF